MTEFPRDALQRALIVEPKGCVVGPGCEEGNVIISLMMKVFSLIIVELGAAVNIQFINPHCGWLRSPLLQAYSLIYPDLALCATK
jgi:hypothetical protein